MRAPQMLLEILQRIKAHLLVTPAVPAQVIRARGKAFPPRSIFGAETSPLNKQSSEIFQVFLHVFQLQVCLYGFVDCLQGLGSFSSAAVVLATRVALPLVQGNLTQDLAAIEPVIRESLLLVEFREVQHGFVGQGRQGRCFESRPDVRPDVAEVALFVRKEFEFSEARSYAYERSDILGESSMGFADIMKSFFAGVVAPEPAILESYRWKRYTPMSGQDPDWTEVRRRGSSRSGDFMQRYC